ncbi:hypothetical protein CFC21_088298 [Triticum aestivum]|uniref:DUF1618 domain-containing protein n=2 Tax=Triticum aestivum TaxID=4565 RepID=A0A3B6PNM8_WHEAT|nr:hypothetical protein CFC21_088298 [Triticum aestivum]
MPTELKRAAEDGDDSTSTRLRRKIVVPEKPVYLVVEHKAEPAYSILSVGTMAPKIPLHLSQRGMSFTAMESPQGSWIVGVGGDEQNHTTIFDVTASKEWQGPWLHTNKMEPILIPHRGQLYVLSSRPSVKRGAMGLDYLPWFEQINFEDGRPNQAEVCLELEPPPIFPCRITPPEYRNPPAIRVASYAMVGSHILLSVQLDNVTSPDKFARKYRKYMGTCGYDVEKKVWEMVHEMNLPFLGQAVPPPRPTLSCPLQREGRRLCSVLHACRPDPVLGELLFPLGRGRFSSVHFRSVDAEPESKLGKPSVVHGTYSIVKENFDDAIIMKQQRQVYKVADRSCPLAHPFPMVAAFAM